MHAHVLRCLVCFLVAQEVWSLACMCAHRFGGAKATLEAAMAAATSCAQQASDAALVHAPPSTLLLLLLRCPAGTWWWPNP